jgi:serine/threonine-protein kinase
MAHPTGDLPPDQWRRVKELFGAALERAPADRRAFLDEACRTEEAELRREVEALLAAYQASDAFLESPASALSASTPSHWELGEGQTLGPYCVLRVLGRGGMATVYLARDERHHRSVALKVLHPELAHALGPERFVREIEVAANLTHPHILPLHDSGEAAGLLYYVMPYIEGESLRDRLRRETQLPVDDALQIAREVGDALAYAHGQGVIHRDIKPENILLSAGHALVADFVIARALSQAGGVRLTESGMAIGTAAYMSPEQASAASHIDGRSDVYSLGCVVYEMLAGEPPYTGPTAQAIIAKRFSDPVPQVRRVRPSVPQSVDRAVSRSLALVAADRFAAAEFSRTLQATVDTPISPMVAPKPESGTARNRTRRSMALAVAALGAGILIGIGALFAWRRSRVEAGESGRAKVLAVLPFENLGDSADAYFADGVANDLRTRLSRVPGLIVIARGSSNEYRRTVKTQQQIARELGVDYLLTATVQWQKGPGSASRVRVTPELVNVGAGHPPQTRWGQQFDAEMTGVFEVQADIAGQVSQALHVAIGDSARHELATAPTHSMPAYDAFLRGQAFAFGGTGLRGFHQAIAEYEQAVALDPAFALAWAELAAVQGDLYSNGTPTPGGAEAARRAAERARDLAPTRPEGYQALGWYYHAVLGDNSRAFTADSTALALGNGNVRLLAALAVDEQALGRWEAARGHLEQAARLDPRSRGTAFRLGDLLLHIRHYAEAEQVLDHGLELLPADLTMREARAMAALGQGDLASARKIFQAVPTEVDPTTLVAFVANYNDLCWVLDEGQLQLLLRLTPAAFDDDRGVWGLVLAQAYTLQGNTTKVRIYADSARLAFEQQLRTTPQDAQRHMFLGLSLAFLERKVAAIREGELGVAIVPLSSDADYGAYYQHQLVRIHLLLGDFEKALDQLEPLLKIPYYLSPGWLRVDPTFAPLRGNPRFERLVNGS